MMDPMDDDLMARQFKALSDPTRIRIVRALPRTADCESVYNVSELAEELNLPQPTVSHHLRILYQAGLVRNKRMCRDVYYWIDEEAVQSVLGALMEIIESKEKGKQ
jgi:DNA-binding transcriptional ArsR family regulator